VVQLRRDLFTAIGVPDIDTAAADSLKALDLIYLSAVDQSALAVPTSSLGPMSKIAQFSS
jgi:hypothetical protein